MGIFSRLTRRFIGRGPEMGSSADSSHLPPQRLDEQFQRIGGGITPSQVSSILYEADTGVMQRLVDLTNDFRQKDGHLQSVLGTRENALTGLPLAVDPFVERGEKEPTEADSEIAGFVEDALKGATGLDQNVRSFTDTLAHLNGAVCHGYAVAETVWRKDGPHILPVGFRHVAPRRMRFRQDDGRLVWQDGAGIGPAEAGVDLQRKWPGNFIIHQPRINGDVPAREGLARLLVWVALFRNWTIADWMKLAELSWKPMRVGTYGKDAGKLDREKLLLALQSLTTNGITILREDVKAELVWPATTGGGVQSSHQALAEFLGAEASKAVLGQTLTTESGSRGARSLGEVHDKVRKDIREYDATSVVRSTLRRDLVRWIVGLNFGFEVRCPDVYLATDDAVDLESFSKGIKNLGDAKVRIGQVWVRDMIGAPQPDPDDEVIGTTETDPDAEPNDDDEEDVDTSDLDEDENDNGEPSEEEDDGA